MSNFAEGYKLKSGTFDKRLMRVQRRSIDWKSQRHDVLEKRRNMSPLQETFQNSISATANDTLKTPSKKNESCDLKARLSKWKQEKEAKKKLQALEKAKKQSFKLGKIERKDKVLYTGHMLKKTTCPTPHAQAVNPPAPLIVDKPVKNLKRKGDELQSSISKKQVLETSKTRKDNLKPISNARVPERNNKRTRTPPTKRVTRQSKTVASRLFAPTASTAAKQVGGTTTRSKSKKAKVDVQSKATPGIKKSPKPIPDDVEIKEPKIDLNKVSTTRGDSFFPDEYTFTAPANLKSYTFNPLSPTSASNFLHANQDTSSVSFFINSPEGRCSTPTPRNNTKSVKDTTPRLKITVSQDSPKKVRSCEEETNEDGRQTDEDVTTSAVETDEMATESSAESNRSFNNDSDDKTVLENTILTRTISVSDDLQNIKVTLTPKSSAMKETSKATPRKSRRLSDMQPSESTTTESESSEKSNSPVKDSRRSVRNKSKDNTTSETDDEQTDIEAYDKDKRSTRSRRSVRKSVHSKSTADKQMPSILEDTSGKSTAEYSSRENDSLIDSLMSDTLLQRSISKFEDSVFESEKVETTTEDSKLEASSEKDIASSEETKNVTTSVLTSVTGGGSTPNNAKLDSSVKRLSKSADKVSISRDDSFRSPGAPMSKRRTRRKTVASSTPTQVHSPEEWIKILAGSPMIEMRRRTPKTKSPGLSDNIVQPLCFDDLDDIPHVTAKDMKNVNLQSKTVDYESVVEDNRHVEPDSTTTTGSENIDAEVPMDVETDKEESEGENMIPEEISAVDGATHDVKYFRNLTQSETDRLKVQGDDWNNYLKKNSHLAEDVQGSIRTVVGQSQLLIAQRFKQFIGLVDNCEFKTGEKETTCQDLQGFWDMIYFQVEDVNMKFKELKQRKDKDWIAEEKTEIKKVIKKKVAKTVKPTAKSKFSAFRAQMAKQKNAEQTEKQSPQLTEIKTFDAGFFNINSPVKKSTHFHCEAGTPRKSKVELPKNDCDKKENTESEKMETAEQEKMETDESEKIKIVEPEIMETSEDKSKASSPKRQALTVLTPSGNDMRTPRRKSYAPTVPSPLLHDITPKPKTRRSLAINTPKRILSDVDVCPLSAMGTLKITTPTSIKTKKRIQKDEATPKRRSLRLRKSVCFTDTPSKAEIENDDLSMFLEPTIRVSSPAQEETGISDAKNEEDSPFSIKHFKQTQSAAKSSTRASSSKRRSIKRRPSNERRRSTRRSVHFDRSPETVIPIERLPHTPYNRGSLVAIPRIGEDDLLFTPPQTNTLLSSPELKVRPSLLFTPESDGEENFEMNVDNLISFTP